ncbi:hypothetical protein ADUPG1_005261, partial [Aduncisulcus paluster]
TMAMQFVPAVSKYSFYLSRYVEMRSVKAIRLFKVSTEFPNDTDHNSGDGLCCSPEAEYESEEDS